MKLAVDTYYTESYAKTVGILFDEWGQEHPEKTIISYKKDVLPYESGAFYKRELPCILKLLEEIKDPVDLILVDGYVFLDDEGKGGLGYYLYQALREEIPIIGVAKNDFKNNGKNVVKVYRGKSTKPLYITAVGVDNQVSSEWIQQMHGEYRFPTLLRELDQETKRI